jgi:hypothetical protein
MPIEPAGDERNMTCPVNILTQSAYRGSRRDAAKRHQGKDGGAYLRDSLDGLSKASLAVAGHLKGLHQVDTGTVNPDMVLGKRP